MSDGVTINPATTTGGPTIYTETDAATGFQMQGVKVLTGAKDVNGGPVSATNPFPVQLQSGASIVGSVLGRTSKVAVTPTVTATAAYTAGNEVGGLMTFASIFDAQQSGILQSVRIRCKSVQTAGFKLYLFTANPTNSTWTDKSTPAINAADIPAVVGPFNLVTADSGLGTETTYELDGIGAAILSSTTSLYGVLVTIGTPTFASTSDVTVELTVLKD